MGDVVVDVVDVVGGDYEKVCGYAYDADDGLHVCAPTSCYTCDASHACDCIHDGISWCLHGLHG